MHVTVSMGLLFSSLAHSVDLQNVLREVEKAMFQAKQKEKNEIEEILHLLW